MLNDARIGQLSAIAPDAPGWARRVPLPVLVALVQAAPSGERLSALLHLGKVTHLSLHKRSRHALMAALKVIENVTFSDAEIEAAIARCTSSTDTITLLQGTIQIGFAGTPTAQTIKIARMVGVNISSTQ